MSSTDFGVCLMVFLSTVCMGSSNKQCLYLRGLYDNFSLCAV